MPLRPIVVQTITSGKVVSTGASLTNIDVTGCERISYQANITAASAPTGATLGLQRSNDGVLWTPIATTISVSGVGNGLIEITVNTARFLRVIETIATGSFTYTSSIVGLAY